MDLELLFKILTNRTKSEKISLNAVFGKFETFSVI